jgi:diadenylate cyclase
MLEGFFDYLSSLFHSQAYEPWRIAIELLMIGAVVYTVLRFLHGTRGAKLLQGMIILLVSSFLVVRVLADQMNLERVEELFRPFVWTVLLTTLIVFQPELRRGLMSIKFPFRILRRQSEIEELVEPIAASCRQFSKNKIGALIALERDVGLNNVIDNGVRLDALLSPQLLSSIFWPGSPLHDMGVVVREQMVAAAACQFPLFDVEGYDLSLGSRHRAGISLSLDCDAVIIIVSEETGGISIAERGRLYRNIPSEAFGRVLKQHLAGQHIWERGTFMPEEYSKKPEPGDRRTQGKGKSGEAGDIPETKTKEQKKTSNATA